MLLHRFLPSVDTALFELLSEEQARTSLAPKRPSEIDHVFVSASLARKPALLVAPLWKNVQSNICNYCK